jgi:hypothetical protein
MRLEAETGHINPREDAVLKDKKPRRVVKINKNARGKSVVKPVSNRGVRH